MAVRNQRLKKRLMRGIPILATLVAILVSLLLVSNLEQDADGFSRHYVWVLVFTGLALFLLLLTILARSASLFRKVQTQAPGARLSLRWVRNFLALSLPPALIVYFFAAYFLTRTVDSWFDVQVETALADSLALGQEFLDIRTLEVRNQMRALGIEVEGLEDDPDRLRRALLRRVSASGPLELTLMTADGRVVSTVSFDALSDPVDHPADYALLQAVERGEYTAAEPDGADGLRIRVIEQIQAASPGDPDLLLQAIYPLPDSITGLTSAIEKEYYRYQNVSYLRNSLKQSFLLILTLVVALTVLLAILAALNSARRMVAPISNLADATRKVASGDLQHSVVTRSRDELGFLAHSFNEMTEALLSASEQAESARASLQAQGEYLETVLGSLSAGVLTLGPMGEIVRTNKAAGQILSLPSNSQAGQKLQDIAAQHPHIRSFAEVVMQQIARNRSEWQQEIRLERTGAPLVLLIRGSMLPATSQQHAGHVVVFDDVTILNQAQRDAAWAEVARRLAHEVKNPLTPIRLAAERLRMKLMDKLDGKDGELLERASNTIVAQVEALRKLVDAFGDYAREPKFERAELNLEQLIREVVLLYQQGDPALVIQLDLCKGPPGLEADSGQLRQLLHNLIRNASEAATASDAKHISIKSRLKELDDQQWLELSISDRGTGYPQAVLDNPFEPYVSHKPNGSGLGLAICRKIVMDHNGRISISNQPGSGALVHILLPLRDLKTEQTRQRESA